MFQLASLFGMAASTNHRPALSSESMLWKVFQLEGKVERLSDNKRFLDGCTKQQKISTKHLVFHSNLACVYEQNLIEGINKSNRVNVTLKGYFQSYKYFKKVNTEIRQLFAFSKDVQIKVDENFEEIRTKFS